MENTKTIHIDDEYDLMWSYVELKIKSRIYSLFIILRDN